MENTIGFFHEAKETSIVYKNIMYCHWCIYVRVYSKMFLYTIFKDSNSRFKNYNSEKTRNCIMHMICDTNIEYICIQESS